nr:MAG TPA: hypothetical protein [Caudoviricetes sp.]
MGQVTHLRNLHNSPPRGTARGGATRGGRLRWSRR